MKPLFQKITIVGVGLIGGSLGLAIQKRKLAYRVIGVVSTDAGRVDQIRRKKAVHDIKFTLEEGVCEADLVILSSRIFTIIDQIKKIRRFLKPSALVIDVGSTKQRICEIAKKYLPEGKFVGCHPMAGSEKRGVTFSKSDLFKESYCFIQKHHDKVEEFWKRVGATPIVLNPAAHDVWVAQVSHRPHLQAFASFDKKINVQRYNFAHSLKFLNPSFKELARLAKSEPEIWADILSSNSHNILSSIKDFEEIIRKYRTALNNKSDEKRSSAILKLLVRAKQNADFFLPD